MTYRNCVLFAATGMRNLTDERREALRELLERSFGPELEA